MWHCDHCLQEEEEADYKNRFPDYHTSFADILEALRQWHGEGGVLQWAT